LAMQEPFALAEALKVNTALTTLDLSGCSIGSNGVMAIAKALKVNTSLTTLRLIWNVVGADGAEAMLEALTVNNVLTTLDLTYCSVDDALLDNIQRFLDCNENVALGANETIQAENSDNATCPYIPLLCYWNGVW
jgi:Ran GTPase-activating protein (RanGAP) involved in mRNA processing and transport